MSGNTRIIEFVALVVVAAGLAAWVVLDRPQTAEIEAAVAPAPSLPATIFTGPVTAALNGRRVFGTVPVTPHPADPPRSSPFE